jgi:hypothetical protein
MSFYIKAFPTYSFIDGGLDFCGRFIYMRANAAPIAIPPTTPPAIIPAVPNAFIITGTIFSNDYLVSFVIALTT